ncbi:MAG: Cbb3-type cytochrome oxidase component FixQ [Pseudomonadota bacterium]|jgi:cytochrome c oxidase cbb3-type subunit 4
MSYQVIAFFTQTAVMIFFIAIFIGVLVYALSPSNKDKFTRAAKMPLEDETYDPKS